MVETNLVKKFKMTIFLFTFGESKNLRILIQYLNI